MGSAKPHAVCIPFPAQGHINPMMHLAKLLHWRGFSITFVNTEFGQTRLLKSMGPSSLTGFKDFRFETISEGFTPSDRQDADNIALTDSIRKNCLIPFRNLVMKLNSSSGIPPVTLIVSDANMTFTLQVANELCIPEVLLWSTSAAAFMAWLHCWELRDRGYKPVEDENFLTKEFLETNIDWIPGMPNLRLKDMPSFVRTMDPQDIFYLEFVTGEMRNAFKSSALILNTFDELEIEILTAIRSKYQELYTVGPLSMLCRHLPETPLNSMGLTLWEGSCASAEWLNRWEAGSVLYVNFGSVSLLTNQQLIEFAWGLANSNQPFMWVIRPDLVIGESAALPPDFTEEIKERGLIVNWCSQEQVLNHPSVGGFLTHCGWNSTMESVCAGVPMICWPFWSDQPTNCKYICSEWKLGMEIDSKVKREEVAGLVRELMVGKKGIEMRMNAQKWKKSALDATEPGGSSYLNLSKFCSGLPVGKQPDSDGKY